MASLWSYFAAPKDTQKKARETIVQLRQHLIMNEKREEHLMRQMDEEDKKARDNAVKNKSVALAALRRKKMFEQELNKLSGTRLQLEMQINTLESANFNQETMQAMKKGADALKVIHGNITLDKVDATMAAINEQREIANEISEAISNPLNAGIDLDEDELKNELAELEQEELNDRLAGAERAPTTKLPSHRIEESTSPEHSAALEDDEDAELRALQAELAM